jgi:putative ABC transport system permease protein
MLIAGWGMVQFSLLQFSVDGLIEGFIALNLIVSGFSLAVPFILRGLMQGLLFIFTPIMSVTGRMAIRGINTSMSRTGLAVAALTVAISMTVGVGIMVSSFRYTVAVWLEQSMNGDIYISIP